MNSREAATVPVDHATSVFRAESMACVHGAHQALDRLVIGDADALLEVEQNVRFVREMAEAMRHRRTASCARALLDLIARHRTELGPHVPSIDEALVVLRRLIHGGRCRPGFVTSLATG